MSAGLTAIVVVLVLPFVLLPVAAIASALGQPEESWVAVGRSRTAWTVVLFLFPVVVGFVAAVAYFTLVRPKFPSVLQAPGIEPGTSVVVRSGPDAGRQATVLGRSLLFRPSGALKIRFADDGKRAHYPPQALQPAEDDAVT